jgi:hypothetical protein
MRLERHGFAAPCDPHASLSRTPWSQVFSWHRAVLVPLRVVRPYVLRNKTDRTDAKGLLEAFRRQYTDTSRVAAM